MNELAEKSTSIDRQHKILYIIDKRLRLSGNGLSNSYIKSFHSNGRSKLAIFYDICNTNEIEPTTEICQLLLGYDEKKFRNEWLSKRLNKPNATEVTSSAHVDMVCNKEVGKGKEKKGSSVVYMSGLLMSRFPETCGRLTQILEQHNVRYAFLEGTKDIWCRDYMPIQTPSGKLIQFGYDPSYLRDPQYSGSRSDVKEVDAINHIIPLFSEINLDGGNVVMYGNKAIVTDRVFSENPDRDKEKLIYELSKLLECEIILIPAYKPEYDFTGHADGMIRFIDSNTVLVNNLDQDFKYMKEGISKALEKAKLSFINFPWFDHKVKGNNYHAIGIYLNYLEVDNLIVMPVFGVPGNKDAEALTKLKEVFPDKTIETINCSDIALQGGILNCITWIIKK